MKKPLIVGNWKMNLLASEAAVLARSIVDFVRTLSGIRVVLAPSFTLLSEVRNVLSDSNVGLACQNFYFKENGAYTGEISVTMIKEAGCDFAILGHSERRHLFGETDDLINKKLGCAVEKGINSILCVGETGDQRKTGKTFEIIEQQLCMGLAGLEEHDLQNISIAYEPVWAIGTGETATPELAGGIHGNIRAILGEKDEDLAIQMRVLYGGSVNPANAAGLMAEIDIDGALVGGASLIGTDFVAICKATEAN